MQLPNLLKTPSFLQTIQWVSDPVNFMESAARQYPDIFTAKTVGFGDTVVFVNHPQAIQEIFTQKSKKFVATGELNKTVQPLTGSYSLLLQEGSLHKQRRQFVMPSFHGERLRSYSQFISQVSETVFNQLPHNKPFFARAVTQEIALQVIIKTVFGISEGERYQELKRLLPLLLINFFQSPLNSIFLFFPFLQVDLGTWNPWGRFVRQRQQIDELIYAEIADRCKYLDEERTDILSLLISARDENGEPMSHQELRDQVVTLMLAGFETTATAMAWALYWIHYFPQVREKLLQELRTVDDSLDPMGVVRLPYLTAVCQESLRISPVLMITLPRVVQEPVELMGYQLEPGTVVVGCIYLVHQREDLYPQPKEFRPERFLERQFSPYEFMPFGGGSRRCLGDTFAQFEIKIALANILSRYQLELVNKQPEQLERRGTALGPKTDIEMIVTGKQSSQEPLVPVSATSGC